MLGTDSEIVAKNIKKHKKTKTYEFRNDLDFNAFNSKNQNLKQNGIFDGFLDD